MVDSAATAALPGLRPMVTDGASSDRDLAEPIDDLTSLDDRRRAALESVAGTDERILRARADRLAATVEFAHLYPALDGHSAAAKERHAHGEAVIVDEGDGCPLVTEFATLEYAARLKMKPEVAAAEITTALKLRHRLPQVWDRVMSLKLSVRVGEELAWATADLPRELCVRLGAELAAMAIRVSGKRLVEHAKARVLQLMHQPSMDERAKALRNRTVRFTRGEHTTHVEAFVSHQDGLWLKAQLDRVAAILGRAGDGSPIDVRRSKALGLLASPARGLQLLQADLECRDSQSDATHDALFDDLAMDPACPAAGQRGHSCGQITVDPDKLLPNADLVVHISDVTLREAVQPAGDRRSEGGSDSASPGPISCESGVAKVDGIGPALAVWLRDLLADSRVHVRPVLNLHEVYPADSYQVPPKMREALLLRHPTSIWPYSTRASKGLDQDHTRPFAWDGTPGQTRVGNLGPLTRREHRAKTFGDWAVAQPSPGVFDYRSPLGYHYRVDPTGTTTTGMKPPRPGQAPPDLGPEVDAAGWPNPGLGWRSASATGSGAVAGWPSAAASSSLGVSEVTRRYSPQACRALGSVGQASFDYREWEAERHFDAIEVEWDRQEREFRRAASRRSAQAITACAELRQGRAGLVTAA